MATGLSAAVTSGRRYSAGNQMEAINMRFSVSLCASAAVLALGIGGAAAENLRLMTGPQGGSWYPMGGAIKNIVESNLDGVTVQVLPGAGIANVTAIEAGKADIAFANSVSTVDAVNGKPPFDTAAGNVCNVATLYPQYFQIVTLADAGVQSVADFKGKAFTTQPTGNTGEAITQHLLQAYDLTYDDLSQTSFVSYNDSVSLLKDGNAVGFTLGTTVPASAIMDLASARDIKVLEVPDDKLARMQEINAGYKRRMIPAGSYPGQDADVGTIGYATHIVARCDLDEATIAGLVDQLIANQGDLAAVAKAVASTTPEDMAADIGVPMHGGATKAFTDKGVL
jgi:TRAP transporter TAXI family solute receptor